MAGTLGRFLRQRQRLETAPRLEGEQARAKPERGRVLAFTPPIAVEIVIGALVDAGALPVFTLDQVGAAPAAGRASQIDPFRPFDPAYDTEPPAILRIPAERDYPRWLGRRQGCRDFPWVSIPARSSRMEGGKAK